MISNRLYIFGFTAILFYHCYQVWMIGSLYEFSCRQMEEEMAMQAPPLPRRPPHHPHHHHQSMVDYVNETKVSCLRNNITYVFPRQPAYVIIGTQKGGTSALSAILDHHPWMQATWYFEPHFFDFNTVMLNYKFRLNEPEAVCKVLRTYLQKNYNLERLRKYPYLMAFEKTPSYILTPNAPARIKAVIPWAKIIVTLRNPVDRLISHHKMSVARGWEDSTFSEHMAYDLNVLRHSGYHVLDNDPFNSTDMDPPSARALRKFKTEGCIYRGMYARQLMPWLKHYEVGKDLLVVRYEEMRDEPRKVLNEVLDFVSAPRYDFPDVVLDSSHSPGSSRWKKGYEPNITAEERDYLKRFYKPYNDELVELLGEEWRGVWD